MKGLSTSQVVELALTRPRGDCITKEYRCTKSLTDSSRRLMINILVADMTEKHGQDGSASNCEGNVRSRQS